MLLMCMLSAGKQLQHEIQIYDQSKQIANKWIERQRPIKKFAMENQ